MTDRQYPPFRRFVVTMGFVALVAGSIEFVEVRTPGSLGLLLAILGFVVVSVLLLVGFIRAIWNFRRWTWKGFVPLVVCVAAPFVGREAGLKARDARFEGWRLPIYLRMIDRVKSHVVVPPYDHGPIQVELADDERDVAYRVDAWTDSTGNLVMRFWWAGTGPPPKHWTYQFFAGGQPAVEDSGEWPLRQVKPGWYEVRI